MNDAISTQWVTITSVELEGIIRRVVREELEHLPLVIMTASSSGLSFLESIHNIRDRLTASGYQPRTQQEVAAELEAERNSW
jgi:hypothetical protein